MTDYADDAQDGEATFLAKALAKAQAAPGPGPELIDGVPCCAECGDPIPAARLKALPGVGLCMGCAEACPQRQFERTHKVPPKAPR